MVTIKSVESPSDLSELKKAYFEQATVPLDGMWHFGFAPMAKHFGFYLDKTLVGFCCINDEGYMLQFYLEPNSQAHAQALFTLIAEQNSATIGEVKGAFASTAEPAYMSYCLDNSPTFKVNSKMYQQSPKQLTTPPEPVEMQLADTQQLETFVDFAHSSIGAPEQWLNGYYTKLIDRNELFGYWDDGQLLAAGECRLFDEHQTEYADLGVIVAQSARGQGIAGQVLTFLKKHATDQGLKSMCSTESDNIGAQKAISRAGFVTAHRIVQFEFTLA